MVRVSSSSSSSSSPSPSSSSPSLSSHRFIFCVNVNREANILAPQRSERSTRLAREVALGVIFF